MEMMETVEVYEESDVRIGEEVESCYTLMEVTSPKRKKRNKTQEDSTEKQKKPRSAYLLYYFDVHQSMQQEYPSMPQSEINKRISESWRRLTVADKAFYLEKAKQEREGADTTSPMPSQDLSGFRKILPRANYVLLPRSYPSQVGLEPQECPGGDGGLALGGRVELVGQCVQSLRGEDATVTLQGGLPSSSPSAPMPNYEPQNSTGAGLLLMGEEPKLLGGDYSTVGIATEDVVQQVKGEAAHLVTLLPGQSLLEPTALPGASTVGAVVMVPVAASGMGVDPKPSFKMAVKTYTRRGRGRCQTVGCPYVYVTRHKPLSCPNCGRDLGGKWMPSAKKMQGKKPSCPAKPSSPLPQGSAQGQAPDPSHTKTPGRKRESLGCRQNRRAEERAVTAGQPPEGSNTDAHTQTALTPSRVTAKGKGQERSTAIGQKRPMRPILPAYCNTGQALLQCITVPSDKGKTGTASNSGTTTALSDKMSALKPNTLKQLGQAVPVSATLEQSSASPPEGSQYILTDNGVKRMSVVPLSHPSTPSLDLGLSTARGRGRCKNPSCDYVYKNRHKPAECPCCGWELSRKTSKSTKCGVLLDPYVALSAAQRELQRQSTLQLLRRDLQIPESEAELRDTLGLIQELNSPQEELSEAGAGPQQDPEAGAAAQHGWPRFYESAATHCGLCHYPLFKGGQSSVAGQEDCWLLTESLIQTASLQLKVCLNTQCLALHSFTHLHPGLFNIGNRLLVSLDLFLKIRTHVRLGQNPSQAVTTIFNQIQNHPVHGLTSEESLHVHELLVSGYWAFECLTVRDYNDMICGVCGVAPKVEISQRYTSNVLELKHVEFTWPEFGSPDEVRVDDFWLTMEREALEQAAFPSDVPITRVDASIIAPFLPPLFRSSSVINTEKDKLLSPAHEPAGDPSALVRLIHEGHLRPEHLDEHSEEELRAILEHCGESAEPHCTQDELLVSLISLYTRVQSGLPTSPHPPPHLTAGKLSKVCPHQVVCGSKFLVRGETARDHVDLLLSSRFWPPVYATDAAQQVALCTDMQYPELAFRMWGWNQGCFSDPTDKPQFVSCAELQDQPYSADQPCVDESVQVHPATRSAGRWLVHPTGAGRGQERYAMGLCRELEPHSGLVADLFREGEEGEGTGEGGVEWSTDQEGGEERKPVEPVALGTGSEGGEGSVSWVRSRPQVFHNAAYYYLFNRLTDFLSSREIVAQQIGQVLRACQPGQVVIRDALYRLGVAQINTEGVEEGE
ncbi:HMG domain-containing protein 3, partial [Osmerus eperlanus]|uniref:HMG domain-containing protein 3 n=1 Tax=Osmerus eperlanus TaxID=29151 RepID=UPI002E115FCB